MDINGITLRQFHDAEGVEDWRVVGDGACAFFRTGSFAAGVRLVRAIGELAGLGDHHPDVDLRREGVTVRLLTVTDDWYGLSERDLELARRISALAREQGVPADLSMVQSVQVSIDALVGAAGGRLLTDEHAPAWWVLADPEGNEACVATSMSRD
jgi:4a-hydroxytetrahydrobiopterin dehydratase